MNKKSVFVSEVVIYGDRQFFSQVELSPFSRKLLLAFCILLIELIKRFKRFLMI